VTEAMRLGACDYISKPFNTAAIRSAVARALERLRLRRGMEIIYELGQQTALVLDVSQIAEAVVDATVRAVGCEVCCLWRVDRARREICRLAGRYPPEIPHPPSRLPLDDARGVIAAAARTGEQVYVPDVSKYPHHIPSAGGIRTEIAVPLQVRSEVVGVLAVESCEKDAFGITDRRLLSALANQAAGAIERTRLHQDLQQRAEELALLYTATQVLAATLNLEEVLLHVLEETKKLLGAEAASVLLYDPEESQLVFTASVGTASDGLMGMRMPADAGIAGWVLREGKPLLVQDAQADPRFYAHIDAATGLTTRSLLAVPLVYRTRKIGVLEVVDERPGVFDERHLSLLTALASSAAIAIENAQLHEGTARLLAEARVLQEVTLAAASTLDFDQVLTRTIQAIQRALHIDYLVFALPDESGERLIVHPSLIGFVSPSAEYLHIPLEKSICGRAYTTGKPELVEDLDRDTHYFRETPGLRSLLAVPVKVEDRVIAVLAAGSVHPAAFSRGDLRLFEAIAAQLGIVIENARLYEAERELRRLLEQSRTQLVMNERLAVTGRLAASLAHEINNPLQAVHNSLQLMLSFSLSPEEQQEYLCIAAEEVKRLMRLVSRILDFARRPRRGLRPVQVNDLVTKMLGLCNKYLQHHRIAVRRNLAPDIPPVQANPDELSQVFLNLVLNAADAMPDGGTLHVTSHLTEDGQVAISFADTGHGVPDEYIERIFEPFFTTKEGGSGLGLSVSRDIVRRYGGEIIVQSMEGEGATFTVLLPAPGKEDA